MKKLLVALALCIPFMAHAVEDVPNATIPEIAPVQSVRFGVGLQYDHDTANVNSRGSISQQKSGIGVGAITPYGSFDYLLYDNLGKRQGRQGEVSDHATGQEVGYGLGIKLDDWNLRSRVAIGYLSNIALTPTKNTARYETLGFEVAHPIYKDLAGYASYRYRFKDDIPTSQNRYTLGVNYTINKNMFVKVGYSKTLGGGVTYNGVTSGLYYVF